MFLPQIAQAVAGVQLYVTNRQQFQGVVVDSGGFLWIGAGGVVSCWLSRYNRLLVRSRSSAGQSERFLNARSEVRDLPGTPRYFFRLGRACTCYLATLSSNIVS